MPTADLILEQHDEKRSNRRVFWSLLWLALSLLLGAPLIWSWSVTRKWEGVKAEYEAAGETLDLAKLEPKSVPDEENVFGLDDLYPNPVPGAIAVGDPIEGLEALCHEVEARLEDAQLHSSSGFQDLYRELLADSPGSTLPPAGPDAARELLKWIDREVPWIPKVISRLDLPQAAFRAEISAADPLKLRSQPNSLQLRNIASWEANDADALESTLSLQICLRSAGLKRHFSTSRQADQWVDILWTALHERRFNEAQCRRLLRQMSRFDLQESCLAHHRRTVAFDIDLLDRCKRGMIPMKNWRLLPDVLFDQSAVTVIEDGFETIGTLRHSGLLAASVQATARFQPLDHRLYYGLAEATGTILPYYGRANSMGNLSFALRLQTKINLAKLALAAELYRFRHGDYPVSAIELIPEFMTSLPVDLMDGKPLRYARDGSRYRIWSIGRNGVDDGGKFFRVTLNSSGWTHPIHDGDWVWFYPTKAPE
jgi:hypothetical protein